MNPSDLETEIENLITLRDKLSEDADASPSYVHTLDGIIANLRRCADEWLNDRCALNEYEYSERGAF